VSKNRNAGMPCWAWKGRTGCCGGRGAVGSFCFLLSPAIAGGVGSMGVVGGVGVRTGIAMGRPSCGRGTISGGRKYHTGIANTMLGSVSVAATWKDSTPGGG
jgi:hypothetical protein